MNAEMIELLETLANAINTFAQKMRTQVGIPAEKTTKKAAPKKHARKSVGKMMAMVLRAANRPLSRKEIFKAIKKTFKVEVKDCSLNAAIQQALAHKKLIKRVGRGTYTNIRRQEGETVEA